jgi:Xaa-Pro aminopeptidase
MPADRFARRREKLLKNLRSADCDALLVSNEKNVSYLTGFTGDSSTLILGKRHALLLSDTRYETQLEEECPGWETVIRTNRQPMEDIIAEVAKKAKIKSLGFESDTLTVSQHEKLREKADGVEWVALAGQVEELRQIKDAEEIAETREAVRLAERGFEVLKASLTPESTELEVAHDLEHTMRRFGARGVAFPPIVAVGDRAALPHAHPGRRRISEAGFVLVDWGAETFSGYKSDLTRILATGKIPPKLEKIYRVVLKAQQEAIQKIRPGAKCSDIDAAARNVIEAAGFGKNFGHGLGHSIGLSIHEWPRFAPTSEEELKPGMILTVEPGIYLPRFGGVRIEDDVLITKDGCEVLSKVPKQFEEIFLTPW